MIFDKGTKIILWGKNSLLNKHYWKNWIYTCQRIKLGPYLVTYIKINSKWVKDPNVRAKTTNLLEEKIKEKLHDIGFGNDFLHVIPKAQATNIKIYKSDYIKI